MNDAARVALIAGAIIFVLMVALPIASFLLKAIAVAGLGALAVYVVMRLMGR